MPARFEDRGTQKHQHMWLTYRILKICKTCQGMKKVRQECYCHKTRKVDMKCRCD